MLSKLFPGRQLVIIDGVLLAHVYPLGISTLKKASGKALTAIAALAKIGPGSDTEASIAALAPTLLEDGIELVQECVRFELLADAPEGSEVPSVDQLPASVALQVAVAVIEDTFDEGRLHPLKTAMASLRPRLAGLFRRRSDSLPTQ